MKYDAITQLMLNQVGLEEDCTDLPKILSAIERHLLNQALIYTHGNKAWASELMFIGRTTLVEKLRKHELIPQRKGLLEEEGRLHG